MAKRERIDIHPCLVVYNHPENGLVCMIDNNEFETPGIWGIVLADVVQHLANAYAKDGMSGQAARQDIVHFLLAELGNPTDKAQAADAQWHEDGFTIGEEEDGGEE